MNTFADIIKSILSRPLIGWASLSLAAGAYLFAVQVLGFHPRVSDHAADILMMASIGIAFIGTILFSLLASARLTAAAWPRLRKFLITAGFRARLRKTSAEAQAIIALMAYRNEKSIWLMPDLSGPEELRKKRLLVLQETSGQARHYALDRDIHALLQLNMAFIESLGVQKRLMDRIEESAKAASATMSTRWMGL